MPNSANRTLVGIRETGHEGPFVDEETPCSMRKDHRMADADFKRQLQGFSLTTAEIVYRLPDHPSLLQTYVWQDYDLHPLFPKLKGFLGFWMQNIEGRLHKVLVAHNQLIRPSELRLIDHDFKLN
jgi:uncharacterized protein Usg